MESPSLSSVKIQYNIENWGVFPVWKCGNIGIREGKSFKCLTCGHVDHADANASFNLALRPPLVESIGQLHVDRDACKGSTDTPRGATLRTTETPEPPKL